MRQTAKSLEKRINDLGTTEPEIWTEGSNRIRVRDFLEGASSIVYGELQKPLKRVEVKDKQKLLEISTRLLHQKITFQLDETVLWSLSY